MSASDGSEHTFRHVVGWATIIGTVIGLLTWLGITRDNNDRAIQTPSAAPNRHPTTKPQTAASRPPSTTKPEPSDQILYATAAIETFYRVGPHRIAACAAGTGGCSAGFTPVVMSKIGQLGYPGCYITWTLTRRGSSRALDAGAAQGCSDTIYVDPLEIPAGKLRFNLVVETDSGQKVSGHYDFSAVSIPR